MTDKTGQGLALELANQAAKEIKHPPGRFGGAMATVSRCAQALRQTVS